MLEFLGFSESNPDSIVECVAKSRENARTIRHRISREMWEDLNSLYLDVSRFTADDVLATGPHRFCDLVKSGGHRYMGVSRATFPRDEGWHFLNAGQALERAEMTARIVDVQYHALLEGGPAVGDSANHQWMAVLKSVAAYEFYRRTYNTRIDPERVAELLVLHPQHPRSLRFASASAGGVAGVSGSGPGTYANEAERSRGGSTTASSTTASRTSWRAGCTPS